MVRHADTYQLYPAPVQEDRGEQRPLGVAVPLPPGHGFQRRIDPAGLFAVDQHRHGFVPKRGLHQRQRGADDIAGIVPFLVRCAGQSQGKGVQLLDVAPGDRGDVRHQDITRQDGKAA